MSDVAYCPLCGKENQAGYRFCIHCGMPTQAGTSATSPAADPTAPTVFQVGGNDPTPRDLPPPARTPLPVTTPHRDRPRWPIAVVPLLLSAACCACLAAIVALAAFAPGALPADLVGWLPVSLSGDEARVLLVRTNPEDGTVTLVDHDRDGSVVLVDGRLPGSTLITSAPGGPRNLLVEPGLNALFFGGGVIYASRDGDAEVLMFHPDGGNQPVEVIGFAPGSSGYAVLLPGDQVFIGEFDGQSARCYVWQAGNEAQLVQRGEQCFLSGDQSTIIGVVDDATGLTINAFDVGGDNPVTLVSEARDVRDYAVAGDGQSIALVLASSEGEQVRVIGRDGLPLAESPVVDRVVALGGANRGPGVYFVAEESGEQVLRTLTSDGFTVVATGAALGAQLAPDGSHLVYYRLDASGQRRNLTRVALATGEEMALAGDATPVGFLVIGDADVLIRADVDGETRLSLATPADAEPREILRGPYTLSHAQRFGDLLMVAASDSSGEHSLFALRPGDAAAQALLSDWPALTPLALSPDRSTLVLSGSPDRATPPGLYSLTLETSAAPVRLDRLIDTTVTSVAFLRDPRQIAYTVADATGATRDTRVVRLDGTSDASVQYAGYGLVDAAWPDAVAPREWVFLGSAAWAGSETVIEVPEAVCANPVPLTLGETVAGEVATPEDQPCFAISLANDTTYTFVVESRGGFDGVMSLFGSDGQELAYSDDDGRGLNPRIVFAPAEAGGYVLRLGGFEGSTGSFTLTAYEGNPPVCERAIPLRPGTVGTGLASVDDDTCFELALTAGETVTISVVAPGDESDTVMTLYDASDSMVAYDDDSGGGLNPQIVFTPEVDGRYYAEVKPYGDGEYDYRIELVPGGPPGPESAEPLAFNERVSRDITADDTLYLADFDYSATGHFYVFEAEAGDRLTIETFAQRIGSDADTLLVLFDEAGSIAAENDDHPELDTLDSRIDLRVDDTGRYVLMVAELNGQSGPAIFYDLLLTRE